MYVYFSYRAVLKCPHRFEGVIQAIYAQLSMYVYHFMYVYLFHRAILKCPPHGSYKISSLGCLLLASMNFNPNM